MSCSDEIKSGKEDKEKVYRLVFNAYNVIPMMPSGVCIGVRASKKNKESYILLRFITSEWGVDVPIATLALSVNFAKEFIKLLNDAIEKIEKAHEEIDRKST